MVLSTIDYIVIALYFAIIVGIGFVSMRFAKSKEEYLVAGRRLSFPLFFGCMAAMALGGGSTIGSTQLGYEFGLGGIWLNFSIGIGLILTGILVTSKLSKLRALSVNEVVEGSYGATARIFSSALTLIYELALSVTQVISIGTIISGILGLDSTLSMVVGGGVVILYTLMGGMWSVTMTDIVQFVIKTVGILVLAPLFCISAAGGWDQLVSKVPETYFSIGSMGFDKSFAYVVLYVPVSLSDKTCGSASSPQKTTGYPKPEPSERECTASSTHSPPSSSAWACWRCFRTSTTLKTPSSRASRRSSPLDCAASSSLQP